tara:strand:+ start:249 stop:638 length:390 start_codon:yes stop_codon:yes gene_type:complete
MAAQVLAGNTQTGDNLLYTNNTGQNVRVVINFIMGSQILIKWGGNVKLSCNVQNLTSYGRYLAFHQSGVNLGSHGDNANSWGEDNIPPLPTEIALANGHTFSIENIGPINHDLSFGPGGYNIVVIPESG